MLDPKEDRRVAIDHVDRDGLRDRRRGQRPGQQGGGAGGGHQALLHQVVLPPVFRCFLAAVCRGERSQAGADERGDVGDHGLRIGVVADAVGQLRRPAGARHHRERDADGIEIAAHRRRPVEAGQHGLQRRDEISGRWRRSAGRSAASTARRRRWPAPRSASRSARRRGCRRAPARWSAAAGRRRPPPAAAGRRPADPPAGLPGGGLMSPARRSMTAENRPSLLSK